MKRRFDQMSLARPPSAVDMDIALLRSYIVASAGGSITSELSVSGAREGINSFKEVAQAGTGLVQ
jgi:hypothetical protein